ncbi:unnamed protein product [Closterium sp. Naga37s-1]|nr:unnamed protein product [Closterium sp. Naga37s-1]
MRKHGLSRKHQDALNRKERAEGGKVGQRGIDEYEDESGEVARLKQLLLVVLFICKSDVRIALFVGLVSLLQLLKTPNILDKALGTYLEALAAKDAATNVKDFNIVDKVVRSMASLIGNRSVVHSRFLELQQILHATQLEMQGIKDARWLSRGDAIDRFVAVLPSAIVLLHEQDKDTYHMVTSLKFHFFLYFIADVLKELNELNRKFQRRAVDVTHVSGMVENTCAKLTARYVEYGVNFAEDSDRLTAFLEERTHPSRREVKVEGMDSEGNAVTHTFQLHELPIPGVDSPPDLESCVRLATKFAKEVVGRLKFRFKSLATLVGSKLFLPDAYPDGAAKRDRITGKWFRSLRTLFNGDNFKLWRGARQRRPAKEDSGEAKKDNKRKGLAAESDDVAPEAEAVEKAYPAVKKRRKRDKVPESDSEDDGLDVRATQPSPMILTQSS